MLKLLFTKKFIIVKEITLIVMLMVPHSKSYEDKKFGVKI